MSLVLKVACPSCGYHQDSPIGTEVRCDKCGHDFRALGHGEGCTRIISVTPDELEHVSYSQRSTEVPRSTASSLIISDPALLDDKLLRDLPLKDNARWAGRVRLIKKLGQGGMGAVYRGFDESLGLDVAVKILPVPPGGSDARVAERLRMEARISAQINHVNVVRTRDVGESGGLVYLVMDYIEGQTARQLLDRKGIIPVPQALQIIHDATQGMQAAHERGIVHRDIKPDNILVAEDGRVLLADLGLAKASSIRGVGDVAPITKMGLLLGTPEYMSPEQWDIGANVTPRSDIWSMGVTLWVLLTRRVPFEDSDIGQLAKKIKEAPLPDIATLRPDVPLKVTQILYHCMAKHPQRRYMNAAALASALHQAMMHPDQAEDDVMLSPSSLAVMANETYQPVQPVLKGGTASKQKTAAPAVPAPSSAKRGEAGTKRAEASTRPAERQKVPAPIPTPAPIPASKIRSRSDTRIRRNQSGFTRKLFMYGTPVVAAACASLAFNHYIGFGNALKSLQPKPNVAVVEPTENSTQPKFTAELEITAPPRVKPSEKVFLSAAIKGASEPEKFKIIWKSGKDAEQEGAEITAQLETDKEYEVRAIDIASKKIVARKVVKVETELAVSASEAIDTENPNAPTRLQGTVRGGAGPEQTEVRWVSKKNPTAALTDKMAFEPDLKDLPAGVEIFVFQARRKGAKDWQSAPSDKVWVTVKPSLPTDYTLASNEADRFMKEAEGSDSGANAMKALKEAQKAFERAAKAYPAGDAAARGVECLKLLRKETDYSKLIAESQALSYGAEQTASSDPLKKLEAINHALKPLYEAQALYKRPEVVTEISRLEERANEFKLAYENGLKMSKAFKDRIDEARASVMNAEKYQKLSDALPHWEKAINAYEELKRTYPQRLVDFELEYRKAQDWHDKAYLYTTMGIIPSKPEDPLLRQQNQRTKPGAPPTRQPNGMTPTSKDTNAGRLLEQ